MLKASDVKLDRQKLTSQGIHLSCWEAADAGLKSPTSRNRLRSYYSAISKDLCRGTSQSDGSRLVSGSSL